MIWDLISFFFDINPEDGESELPRNSRMHLPDYRKVASWLKQKSQKQCSVTQPMPNF
jgi:hypothetical protein